MCPSKHPKGWGISQVDPLDTPHRSAQVDGTPGQLAIIPKATSKNASGVTLVDRQIHNMDNAAWVNEVQKDTGLDGYSGIWSHELRSAMLVKTFTRCPADHVGAKKGGY